MLIEYVFVSCGRYEKLAEFVLDWNVHIISWIQYEGPRDRPHTMYFLPNLYNKQSYAIELDNIEIEEFYRSGTVNLSHNSSEFEAFAQGVSN